MRIIYDKSSNSDSNKSTIGYLAKLKNIETCLLEGKPSSNQKYRGLMHMKMAISDNKYLIIGSANWSKSAFETNYETLIILEDKTLIQRNPNKPLNQCFKNAKNTKDPKILAKEILRIMINLFCKGFFRYG